MRTRFSLLRPASIAAALALLSVRTAVAQITYDMGTNGAPNGGEINISGATLFSQFFSFPGSTNDFINANGNMLMRPAPCSDTIPIAGFYDSDCDTFSDSVEQLARPPFGTACPPYSTYWLINQRGVGSGNGLGEFVTYQLLGTTPTTIPTEASFLNRLQWTSGTGVPLHPCTDCDATTNPFCQSSVDIAVMDVPTKWFVISGTSAGAAWNRKPTTAGYGTNPRRSTPIYGLPDRANTLQSLARGALSLNTNTAAPNTDTVFDTPIAHVPVAIIANRGTGVSRATYSELQHLFVTGRMPSGENFVASTRDSGSGTRNACMNSLGIDPSWGMGDNLGPQETGSGATFNADKIGPNHYADNTGSSGTMETVVQHSRLAIGYTGLAGPGRAAVDAGAGLYEVLDVRKDIAGATDYVRPGLLTCLHDANPNTGYQIAGPETFATRGDPEAATTGHPPVVTGPTLAAKPQARDYIRNITQSILAFSGTPDANTNHNMPGEVLAINFFLNASVDAVPDPVDPAHLIDQTGTSAFNAALQNYIINTLGPATLSTPPAYGSVNAAGRVPVRNSIPFTAGTNTITYPGDHYSDGSSNGQYRDPTGAYTIVGGTNLTSRMRVQGDFNVDGQRDLMDIPALMTAIHNPLAFEQADAASNPGDYLVPEIIGDFQGDGNFDKDDVRYFADGLAIDPSTGKLDRKAGFIAVDVHWNTLTGNSNYFGTILAGPKAYAAGDSRADIAGNIVSRGAQPTGADQRVDARDIDYVLRNFGTWSDINQALAIDLSADINGDLVVNQADVSELVHGILCTEYGDVNLDGVVNSADIAIIQNSITTPPAAPSWADGDLNGDNVVSSADLAIANAHLGFRSPCLPCSADIDGNGSKNATDAQLFAQVLLGVDTDPQHIARSDTNGSGAADGDDVQSFVSCLFAP